MRISDKDKGFVFTFAGDEQASVSLFAIYTVIASNFVALASHFFTLTLTVATFYAILWVDWSLY